jgi:H+/gluconate symporter-like permease
MPTFKSEADNANAYPARRFGQRERKLLETVQEAYPFGCVLAGTFASVAGSTSQTRSITGVLSSDQVMCIVKTQGAVPVLVAAVAAGAGSVTVKYSADPGADHVIQYFIFRAQ